ncbi:ferredoxin [Streptomyces sp. NPDC048506]|uniref:ferredoxin n=1 Tax=Streptomyces sp. NPDC048506 TaxID=3155028 RepID=UPI0034333C90
MPITVTISIDRDRCVGAGMCALTAPEVFDQDDEDGLVLLRSAEPSPDRAAAARQAAGLCPARVITVTEQRAPDSPPGPQDPGT